KKKSGEITGSNNALPTDSGGSSGRLGGQPSSSGGSSGGLSGPLGGRSSGTVSGQGGGSTGGIPGGTSQIPPLTRTSIKIGMTYLSDPGAANAAAGFGGIGQVDQRRGFDMIVKA